MSIATYEEVSTACKQVGLATGTMELIRHGENAVWRVDSSTIAKVGRPGTADASARQVAVAHWLSEAGLPAVALSDVGPQPVVVGDVPVVFWRQLPPHRMGEVIDVPRILRQLHALPIPAALGLPRLDPLVRLEQRISESTCIDQVRQDWLLRHVADLRLSWSRLPVGLPHCVVHGDAWVGNVAITPDGQAVLLDLERCSVGPPEWDLVSTAIKLRSFGWINENQYQQFVEVYGSDVTCWAGFQLMRNTRELRMATYLVQLADRDPSMVRDALYRVDCLRGEHGERPWPWTPSL